VLGGVGVRLECKVDKNLVDGTNNWAVQAAFGSWGVANLWGCFEHSCRQDCRWECPKWWSCKRRCSTVCGWGVKNGPFRYWNINDRGSAKYESKSQFCSGDVW